jgi:hypothetical protein
MVQFLLHFKKRTPLLSRPFEESSEKNNNIQSSLEV